MYFRDISEHRDGSDDRRDRRERDSRQRSQTPLKDEVQTRQDEDEEEPNKKPKAKKDKKKKKSKGSGSAEKEKEKKKKTKKLKTAKAVKEEPGDLNLEEQENQMGNGEQQGESQERPPSEAAAMEPETKEGDSVKLEEMKAEQDQGRDSIQS